MTGGRTGASVPAEGDMPGGVPRRNGELVFEAPWESRAFGLAAAYVEASGCGWGRFRVHLMAAIARLPDTTPYYEAWVTAVEELLAADGVADSPSDPSCPPTPIAVPAVGDA